MKYILLVIFYLCIIPDAFARPVSYPEGWTLMIRNDKDANSSHIHYSPTAKYSIGWRSEYRRDNSAHINTLQLNNLLKRWNKKGEQANVYLKSGLGFATNVDGVDPTAFTGLAVDWETRRYFTSYENRFLWADDSGKFADHEARIGVAPYIGDYGDLHTWLMLEANYKPGDQDNFSVTPLIRLFKGTTLIEAGYNLDNAIEFNFIKRF